MVWLNQPKKNDICRVVGALTSPCVHIWYQGAYGVSCGGDLLYNEKGGEDKNTSNDQVDHSDHWGKKLVIGKVINIARMIHGSIMGHIFINFIEVEHYYYVEMPYGPTKVKDGEEQIKIVVNLDDPTFDL